LDTEEIAEKDLIDGLRKKDKLSFEYLVTRYEKLLLNCSMKITGDMETSMEIVQETFLDFYVNLKKFDNKSGIFTYIYRIMLNKSIDHLRRKTNYEKISRDFKRDEGSNDDDIDVRIIVNEALEKLPIKFKMPLLLAEYEKMKYEQIAEILKIPLNTVRTRIFKAREKLLGIFKSMGVEL
jgi:RNA polymerase sigma-70 factor (ECF subfamily)